MPQTLHLDLTWEDTPLGASLLNGFKELAQVEQKWLLQRCREVAWDVFKNCESTPFQALEAWHQACAWAEQPWWPAQRQRVQAWCRWVQSPSGRVGHVRWATYQRQVVLASAEQRRHRTWTHWLSIQAVGIHRWQTLLNSLPIEHPQFIERTVLHHTLDRQQRWGRWAHRLLSPIRLLGQAYGGMRRAWLDGVDSSGAVKPPSNGPTSTDQNAPRRRL